ncbi:hypothetical protein BCR34DRAFT_608042 [Clohesyomyces aquaticus]|uniref:Uncharacterized protein n=1 Tax=Clohesyomyces aquaticus TaxID=1231657 RepID=A0A1Y1YB16_9PLEO|nr:hypothetical protein BCR34DRAFT_608042 [Clohesyomyces aquaticus]
MRLPTFLSTALVLLAATVFAQAPESEKIQPRIFILTTYATESDSWNLVPGLNLFTTQKLAIPGLSPLCPDVHCTANGEVCHITTSEGGFSPQGAKSEDEYPVYLFKTEVFKLNDKLRREVAKYAGRAFLNDGDDPVAAQEDSAILTSLFRALLRLTNFFRIILMGVGYDFDREYYGQEPSTNLLWVDSPGRAPALQNIGIAGEKIVDGILANWVRFFQGGVETDNHVGDVFGTAGGTPEFGPKRVPGRGEDGKGGIDIGGGVVED